MNLSALIKNKKGHASRRAGFTLIELLVVIGILAVLLAITLIAINPARQFAQANDTKRRSDVSAILNAVNQYMADSSGSVPSGWGLTPTQTDITNTMGTICGDLSPTYVANLPADPTTGTPTTGSIAQPCPAIYNANYSISQSASDNRITVCADSELGVGGAPPAPNDICVTR